MAAGEFAAARGAGRRRRQSAALAGVVRRCRSAARRPPAGAGGRSRTSRRGRLNTDALQRLATVLDALDIEVPMTLWDAASRAPQPADGYLPETGRAGRPRAVRQAQGVGRTMLLGHAGARADGPAGANILALGDAMRALKPSGWKPTRAGWRWRRCCRFGRALVGQLKMARRAATASSSRASWRCWRASAARPRTRCRPIAAISMTSSRFSDGAAESLADRRARRYRRLSAQLSEAGMAPASRARRLSAVRQFFKFLRAEGSIAEDPALGFCRPQEGPDAAQDPVGGGGRPPDRGGARAHRHRARAATACGRCGSTR